MTYTDHSPYKKWGQNFISDANILRKIIQRINPQPDDYFVEIGPGKGALTRYLLEKAKHVHAIEIDERLIPELERIASKHPNFSWEIADFLKWEWPQYDHPIRLMGNIPYNITSPLVILGFEHRDALQDVHFLMQKEVAQRLSAQHDVKSKEYGILSIFSQINGESIRLFDMSKNIFYPAPTVDSSVWHFIPNHALEISDELDKHFRNIVRKSFGKRRKTLRNSLKDIIDEKDVPNFDFSLRPEKLSPQDFLQLAKDSFRP